MRFLFPENMIEIGKANVYTNDILITSLSSLLMYFASKEYCAVFPGVSVLFPANYDILSL